MKKIENPIDKTILEYFDNIGYLNLVFKIINGKKKVPRLKKLLMDIFYEDDAVQSKFKEATTLEELFVKIPSEDIMKLKSKLYSFKLQSKLPRKLSTTTSVRAISIPSGGKNR